MSVATLNTSQTFAGTGVQTAFPFTTISFLENTAEDVFDVYIDDVLLAEANWSIAEGVATDGIATGGTLTIPIPPANLAVIVLKRNTDKEQPTVFGSAYTKSASRNAADRNLLIIQEVSAAVDDLTPAAAVIPPSALIPDWVTATVFILDQVIIYQDAVSGRFYRCTIAHTSGTFATDLLANKWEEVIIVGRTGANGATGSQGLVGPQGVQGIQGTPGNDGVDGFFSAKASQAEAEAGVEDTKGMTALKTKQAHDEHESNSARLAGIDADIAANTLATGEVAVRVTAIENNLGINQFSGKQNLNNNEAGSIELLGKFADLIEEGFGDRLRVDADGTIFTRATLLVRRIDNLETRLVQVTLVFHYLAGVWYVARENTTVLNGGNPDGVVFGINQVAEVATLYYDSDNMLGTGYTGDVYWTGFEIPTDFN